MKGKFIKCILFLVIICNVSVLFSQTPQANNDVDTVNFDTILIVDDTNGLLFNDTGTSLVITQIVINNITFNVGEQIVTIGGLLTINADGSYEFIPNVGYSGILPNIEYFISDGVNTSSAIFVLVVDINESGEDLLEIVSVTSCNQGYISPTTAYPNGAYRIKYTIRLKSLSIAFDKNPLSLVSEINLENNLNTVFGGAAILLENLVITATPPYNLILPPDPYSTDWDFTSINSNYEVFTSPKVFTASEINSNILYPRQNIKLEYCIIVDPALVSNPTNFDNLFTVNYKKGDGTTRNDSFNLRITDFHTSETTVAANLFVQDAQYVNDFTSISSPDVKTNGEFRFSNRVIIKNDGTEIAKNVNFNMGLGDFLDQPIPNNVTFKPFVINQISGPTVTKNLLYNGDTKTLLLENGNNLNPGEVVILEINFIVKPLESSENISFFRQLNTSMTQGIDDFQGEVASPSNPTPNAINPIDEFSNINKRRYSYVIWDDNIGTGQHLDRYYVADSDTEEPSSNNQCQCKILGMQFLFNFDLVINKTATITNIAPTINPSPIGIEEYEEITFELSITNKSDLLQIENLQITDDLTNACNSNNIISVSTPIIITSNATQNPVINTGFNGITDFNIFDGSSGILEPVQGTNPDQNIVVQFKVIFKEDCNGFNKAVFSASDPLNVSTASIESNEVTILVSNDTDGDNISNADDIDDDNDGIPDSLENNGLSIDLDTNGDNLPDYLDITAPTFVDNDNNNISDVFDFDGDSVLNQYDLDSDNDGIFDIVEAGNTDKDTNSNGMTNNSVGTNGLDDILEVANVNFDTNIADINYTIPNNDTDANFNYLDIDSDNDGIVDNIEAQLTPTITEPNLYVAPLNTFNIFGIDDAYLNGLTPIDTDGDTTPDYLDINTDDDARDDATEGWDLNDDGVLNGLEITISNGDNDNDGLDNAYDNDDNLINPTNNQTPLSFPNENIPLTQELDWRERLAPIITIIDDTVIEGETLKFGIFLSTISSTDIVIEFTVEDETTAVTLDYEFDTPPITYTIIAGNGLETDPADPDFLTFDIVTIDDSINEIDLETFKLKAKIITGNTANLDAANNLSPINIGSIIDNDPEPIIVINNPTAIEGNDLEFKLSLVHPTLLTPLANHLDVKANVFTNNDTASQPEDYLPISTEFTIPAFAFELPINIITIDNRLIEDLETMKLAATYFDSFGTQLSTDNNLDPNGIGTIIDNDFPNLFSPNGDGLSDVFEIIALKPYGDFKLQIFDRRGSEVYNYRNNNNPTPIWWNGGYKGLEAPAGVYFYTLDYNDGITKPISGFIQLTR